MSRTLENLIAAEMYKGAAAYPFIKTGEEEEDKKEYVWKEPTRKEKIKEGLKKVGWFVFGVLGLTLFFLIYMAIPFAMASIFAFASGIFWQGETYPFFNLLAFKIAGGTLLPVFIFGFIAHLIEDWDNFKDGWF